MKYYKNETNELYAYEEDGSQDGYIKPGLIPITEEEANAILLAIEEAYVPPPEPTKEELLAQLQELTAKINSL